VHLAIEPEQASIRVDDYGSVVVQASGAFLKERGNDDDSEFGCERAEAFGGRAWNRFGKIEQSGIFFATEILRAEEFLQTNHLRALARGFTNFVGGLVEVGLRIKAARHLNQADFEFFRRHSNYSRRNLSALFLFDIDGTLVRRTGPHHRQALVDAIRQVTGRETTTEGIPVYGMLDPDILRQMMLVGGIGPDAIDSFMPDVIEAAQNVYQESVPDLRDKRCPGAEALLDELQGRGIVLALVTGNLTRIGWRKLDRAGLHQYFRFGAFGEMAATRGGLARLAIARARWEGLINDRSSISLVGDAPQDVLAARENGIRSIAVRTGITPAGDLEACIPDLLLDDLTHLDRKVI
jgi:phosphoglycolate phosphatase